jgi:hypothetical protein
MFRRSRPCLEEAFWLTCFTVWLKVGVSNVDISLKDQLVKVDATTASYEDVENAIKKTGKVIKSGRIVEPSKDSEAEKAAVETADSSKVVA